jgi:hypothetical protein
MEEPVKQTYAYELSPNSEALLKIKRKELKELREKAAKDRKVRLANKSQRKAIRDDKIEKINLKLKSIKDMMTVYNKAGKKSREGINILEDIYRLIKNDVELMEQIERTMQPKTESVDVFKTSLN